MNTGIYQITNTVNGKIYIGSAVNLRERRHGHFGGLARGEHHNAHLQSSWRKYGREAFEFRVLLICAVADLLFYEQRCIDAFDAVKNGYNKCPIAGNCVGRKVNPESVAKMAATKRGRKQSPEVVAIRRAAMNRSEVKARISKGVSAALRGKPKTPEHIRNAALAQKGKTVSPETRAKLRAANLGKKNGPHSEETRRKISSAQKGRPFTPEHKAACDLARRLHPESFHKAWETRRRNAQAALLRIA